MIEPPPPAPTTSPPCRFNRADEDLDSEWLMQPVLEADYDSETQCCVDTHGGKEASFAEHFVTKRKKRRKKGAAGSGDAAAADGEEKHIDGEGIHEAMHTHEQHHSQLAVPTPKRPTLRHMHEKPQTVVDTLQLPGGMYDRNTVPQGKLSDPATRRLACGAAPPAMRHAQPAPTIFETGMAVEASLPPPSYEEAAMDMQRKNSVPRSMREAAREASTSPGAASSASSSMQHRTTFSSRGSGGGSLSPRQSV